MQKLAIICGSGLEAVGKGTTFTQKTKYGSARVSRGKIAGRECLFLLRHGPDHKIPPHMINHEANVFALAQLGATDIISLSAVGIVNKTNLNVGDIVLPRDFMFFEQGPTLFDKFPPNNPLHADMSEPYNRSLLRDIKKAAKQVHVRLKDNLILSQTKGPRYETEAEVKKLLKDGVDIVGMTSIGEAIIASELALLGFKVRYAMAGITTNFCTGISKTKLSQKEVEIIVKQKQADLNKIIVALAGILGK